MEQNNVVRCTLGYYALTLAAHDTVQFCFGWSSTHQYLVVMGLMFTLFSGYFFIKFLKNPDDRYFWLFSFLTMISLSFTFQGFSIFCMVDKPPLDVALHRGGSTQSRIMFSSKLLLLVKFRRFAADTVSHLGSTLYQLECVNYRRERTRSTYSMKFIRVRFNTEIMYTLLTVYLVKNVI